MLGNARYYAGEACLRIAAACAVVGRKLLGTPFVKLAVDAEMGSRELILDSAVPAGITKGLRVVGTDADEVVRVVSIRKERVAIDRPLALSYPKGAAVKVLI